MAMQMKSMQMKANDGKTVRCSNPSCVGADRRSQSSYYTPPLRFFTKLLCITDLQRYPQSFFTTLCITDLPNLRITLPSIFFQRCGTSIVHLINILFGNMRLLLPNKDMSENCEFYVRIETIETGELLEPDDGWKLG